MIKMMTKVIIKKFINKSVIGILLLTSLIVSSNSIAKEQGSVSFGLLTKNLTSELRQTIAKENKAATIVDQNIGKATGQTRTEILKNNIKLIKPSKITPLARNIGYSNYSNFADFTIYGATTLLQNDYDGDGFHQTFSVSFDADIASYTEGQWSDVYALLYISKNGGPWTHYYTTDTFIIEGDTNLDEYEVITTFLSGYYTDYYDILIDLYQVGYSDTVASLSSDESNALYALSLESADYDEPYNDVYNEPYIEVIEIGHGGSFSIVLLLLFLLTYSLRIATDKK